MEGFDLAGFSGQAERLGRDLPELCGVAKVEPGFDPSGMSSICATFPTVSVRIRENGNWAGPMAVGVCVRVRLTNNDRWFFIQLYRWFPSILRVLTIIRPETLVRWHRAGFRRYWRWKSNSRGGRPQIQTELRVLIRQMSMENPLWGAPRIHGELLKLGFEVAQSSVAKYMVKRRGPPSQGWRTFLRNHAPDIAAMDLYS